MRNETMGGVGGEWCEVLQEEGSSCYGLEKTLQDILSNSSRWEEGHLDVP